jgi:hypothetical protein
MQAIKLKIFLLKISLDFYGDFLHLFKTKCSKFMDNMGLIYVQKKEIGLLKRHLHPSQQLRNGSNLSIQGLING